MLADVSDLKIFRSQNTMPFLVEIRLFPLYFVCWNRKTSKPDEVTKIADLLGPGIGPTFQDQPESIGYLFRVQIPRNKLFARFGEIRHCGMSNFAKSYFRPLCAPILLKHPPDSIFSFLVQVVIALGHNAPRPSCFLRFEWG